MEINNGLLCSYWWTAHTDQHQNTRLQIMVPQALVDQVLWAMHDDVLVGHLGEKSTLEHTQVHYWWAGVYTNIKRYVASCPTCQQQNHPKGRLASLLQSIV
jgi:hypothetical protein